MEAAVAALHEQLKQAGIPHAFGGAFAMAFYGVPRPTSDIDVNVFVPAAEWPRVKNALSPLGIEVDIDQDELRQENQVLLQWEPNPLHLFFSCDPLHQEMKRKAREVPFGDGAIPLVAPEHLIIRKALLDRTKDWHDIEQIFVATSPLDFEEIESWLERMTGASDSRMEKLREVKSSLSLD